MENKRKEKKSKAKQLKKEKRKDRLEWNGNMLAQSNLICAMKINEKRGKLMKMSIECVSFLPQISKPITIRMQPHKT